LSRIVIAAGEPGLRRVLGLAALERGHEVSVAHDGDSALDLLLGEPPDLLVMELAVPGLDGSELLQEIRNCGIDGKTRILVIGTSGTERERERCFELGADEYLARPLREDEILGAMVELLAHSKEALRARREQERDQAHLLSQLESVFEQPRAGATPE
jgi:DNA-binding response OmpR family regulator